MVWKIFLQETFLSSIPLWWHCPCASVAHCMATKMSLSYLDEQRLTKNAHFLKGHRKSASIRWNYNNLVRKLYITWGQRWDQSHLKQTFRGIFSSIAPTGSWGRAVVLISWGNCSSWGSLGRGRGFVCISWPVLNEVITFFLPGRTAFPITSEHQSLSQHLCICVMRARCSFSLLKKVQEYVV